MIVAAVVLGDSLVGRVTGAAVLAAIGILVGRYLALVRTSDGV
jgi:hypothetical protein